MSKAKHTAGPWHCATNDYGYLTSVRNSDDTRKICVSRVNNMEESNANMRLIAASPEMYEMLKFIYSSVDWSSEAWNNDDGQKHKNELESLIKKIEG